MQNHTTQKKVIEVHGIDYLADKLCQTTTKMINILQDIMTIKSFNWYETLITLEKLKERLSLVKNKKKIWYKAERLDQMKFFLETDPKSQKMWS